MRRIVVVVCLVWVGLAQAAVFTVNTPGNPIPLAGQETLSTAIVAASNNGAGTDEIRFAIPGQGPHEVCLDQVGPNLSSMSGNIAIRGYSQSGSRVNTSATGFNAVINVTCTTPNFGFGAAANITANILSVDGVKFGSVRLNSPNLPSTWNITGSQISEITASGQTKGNLTLGNESLRGRNVVIGPAFGTSGSALDLSGEVNGNIKNNMFGTLDGITSAGDLNDQHIRAADRVKLIIGGATAPEANIFGPSRTRGVFCVNGTTCTARRNRFFVNGASVAYLSQFNNQYVATLVSAQVMGPAIQLVGLIDRNDALGTKTFDVDVYASARCHTSGFGEGNAFLGTFNFISASPSAENFTSTVALANIPNIPENSVITIMATDRTLDPAFRHTSGFSNCVVLQGGQVDSLFTNGFE